MNIIKDTFANDSNFVSALDKACTTIVNMKSGNRLSAKAPELVCFSFRWAEQNFSRLSLFQLAHYCDSLLRKSSKTATESEIEEKLLNSITIFKYLDEKDYFQRVKIMFFFLQQR